jgi:hypothetical protein
MEVMKNPYKVLVGKPEGKRLLGRPGCRWEYSIKMGLKEVVSMYECGLNLSGS